MKQLSKGDFFKQLQDCVAESGSQRRAAQKLGVTASHLNNVLRNRKEPGAKLASALGLRVVTNYVPIDEKEEEKNE